MKARILTPLLAVALTLCGCNLGLDKSLIAGEAPPPADAEAQDASVGTDGGQDSSLDVDAGKPDAGSDAKADGSVDSGADGKDGNGTDAKADAQCQADPDAGQCEQCASEHCCEELVGCLQDLECSKALNEYLACSADGGASCVNILYQSSGAATMDLVQCVALACSACS